MSDNNTFKFNYQEYKSLYKSHLVNENKRPKGFISVIYTLPFKLPLDDYTRAKFNYKGEDIVVITTDYPYEKNIYKDYKMESYYSDIEITLLSYRYITKKDSENKMHEAIDLTLEFLQYLLTNLIVKYNNKYIFRITRHDLPHIVPVSIVRSSNFKKELIENKGIINYHLHTVANNEFTLSSKELNELISFMNYGENPFLNSIYFFRNAGHKLDNGNYSESVINLQISMEMYFYTLFELCLKNGEKLSNTVIEKKLKAGFKNILNDHLKKYFSRQNYIFDFDKKSNDNLLNNYEEDIYLLRNKIVHEGYICTELEANCALETGNEILKNIAHAINTSSLKSFAFNGEELMVSKLYM